MAVRSLRNQGLIGLRVVVILVIAISVAQGQGTRNREQSNSPANPRGGTAQPQYLPPGTRPPNAYKLGVYGQNTETGVQLTQVLPSSVAQRAGLESGDVIVTVGGYQVGYVAGRLYDLGDELARRVDSRGLANLLVRNQRNGRLVNVPVQFFATQRVVSGNVSTRDRVTPSPTSVLTVRLLDVTRPQWQNVAIAEVNLAVPRRWPASFRLEVDPANIYSGHRYAVDARVTDRGRVILRTAATMPVRLSESGDRVDLRLVSAGNRHPGGIFPFEQISQWYEQYLGRRPTTREVSAWQADLESGKSLDDVQAGLLSSSEFFDHQQNDRDRYVDEVYRQLNGTPPTPGQHQTLREQLERQGDVRQRFTRDLLQQGRRSEAPDENR